MPANSELAFTATDLHVIGQFAYVAGGPFGLLLLNIRNPAAPAQIFYWDGGAWVKEPSSVLDPSSRTVTATSKRLGVWALMGDARRAALPILRR